MPPPTPMRPVLRASIPVTPGRVTGVSRQIVDRSDSVFLALVVRPTTRDLPATCHFDNLYIHGELPRCIPDDNTLCLLDGRVKVTARWRLSPTGQTGKARARPKPDGSRTGSFWFFNPNNTELLVKALDGTAVNGNLWFFYGALSDVEYWIDVTDTATNSLKTYYNPPGNRCGQSDVAAFPIDSAGSRSPTLSNSLYIDIDSQPAATKNEDEVALVTGRPIRGHDRLGNRRHARPRQSHSRDRRIRQLLVLPSPTTQRSPSRFSTAAPSMTTSGCTSRRSQTSVTACTSRTQKPEHAGPTSTRPASSAVSQTLRPFPSAVLHRIRRQQN